MCSIDFFLMKITYFFLFGQDFKWWLYNVWLHCKIFTLNPEKIAKNKNVIMGRGRDI